MNSHSATAAVLLVAACATTAAAQDEGPRFAEISYGDVVASQLEIEDDSLVDGSLYKMYVLSGVAGDSVTISLSSRDFNTHLMLTDSVDTVLEADDDSGGECNSHLTAVLPTDGYYIVYATSTFRARVGEFELSVQKGLHSPGSTAVCGGFFETKGAVAIGDSIRGNLGPPDQILQGSYYQVWDVSIPVGETATIDLKSGEFDAVLVLYRGFASPLTMDDDGGGACHARLVIEGPSYPIKVMIRSGKEEETGEFQLRVVPGALPVVAESQCLP
ncbi:MAG: PPC domain-containing protein [Gemmatimonadota bacterium]|nr:MAG: PPC domain-containing protein [Gemmatimonadota bacterium]